MSKQIGKEMDLSMIQDFGKVQSGARKSPNYLKNQILSKENSSCCTVILSNISPKFTYLTSYSKATSFGKRFSQIKKTVRYGKCKSLMTVNTRLNFTNNHYETSKTSMITDPMVEVPLFWQI